tara:strand:+ start:517 stop:693 length:177 start_codon:yes stop_codon:yes gene_type:complete
MENPLVEWMNDNGFDPKNPTPVIRALLELMPHDDAAIANILKAFDEHVPGWVQLVKQY